MNQHTLVLDHSDIKELMQRISLDDFMDMMIARLELGLAHHDPKQSVTPLRDGFQRGSNNEGIFEWMPHYEVNKCITIKNVAYTPNNPVENKLPTIIGSLNKFDANTGQLLAVTDAIFLTAVRTGAASAVASKHLASIQSKVLGLVGTGAQALTQLHALSRTFELSEVLVFDKNPAHQQSFGKRAASMGIDVRLASLEDIQKSSDIICTVTSNGIHQPPVIGDFGLKESLHINAVGSDIVGKIELPKQLLQRAYVCPDHLGQALREGECQQLKEKKVGYELAQLCREPGKAQGFKDRLTVFDSTGYAFEDYLALELLIELATELRIGKRLPIEIFSPDVLDPYSFLRK
jgi:ornithine cyclodeaminase/alanine dehydrogenase-like protein (mu-crystallin family)